MSGRGGCPGGKTPQGLPRSGQEESQSRAEDVHSDLDQNGLDLFYTQK